MKIGTYYYPEQWPREQWVRDFDHMAVMGMQIVHVGEFAWASMEPEKGKYTLDWIDEILNLATARKMDVILCTPTAVAPIWLMKEHPELRMMDDHGRSLRHGKRRQGSPTSPAFIEASCKIARVLGQRFGNHPSVIGWQIDNEFSSEFFDQHDYTHAAFRAWLEHKYGSIAKLNAAWGCQFWNTFYTSFDQIDMPADRSHRYGNPNMNLDASRFWSQAFAAFTRAQAEELRPLVGERFITTNFMPFHPDCNPADFKDALNLWTWDAYPVGGQKDTPGSEQFRLADPNSLGLTHDHMASFNGRWALMELQPGQVNWSGYPVLPYPGAVRLWIWTAFAHGAEFVTTYRFRRPLWGIEKFHDGLVGADGTTLSPGGRQFVQAIQEMQKLDLSRVPTLLNETDDAQHTVGLVLDFDQLWEYLTLPQASRWNYAEFLRLWYAAVMRLGWRVKILRPDQSWPKELAMIIAPGLQMVDEAIVGQFHDYVQAGGHLLLTCRTALMNKHAHLHEGPTAAPILDLIGGTIEAYDSLPSDLVGKVELDGKAYPWAVWGDLLYTDSDAKVLARYGDQFYSGTPAVMQTKKANGTVTYCGVYSDQAFVDALIEKLLIVPASTPAPVKATLRSMLKGTAAPVEPPTAFAPRVHIIRRGPYKVLLNYQDQSVEAPAPAGTTFLVGQRSVEPAGVAIWEE